MIECEEARKCRLCEEMVAEGGVNLLDVDLDKLSHWWSACLGTDLEEDVLEDNWICGQCVWDARYNRLHYILALLDFIFNYFIFSFCDKILEFECAVFSL
jgi:hypothetical protein